MNRWCFEKLCSEVRAAVGDEVFKPESYIASLRTMRHTTQISSIFNCNIHTCGEWIQGEVKIAWTLRYLAGASYLDLYLAFHIYPNHILKIVSKVKREWLCHDRVLTIDFYKTVLKDGERSSKISEEFAESSRGTLIGCIGAIDGWLCKINCPSKNEVKNPGKYMSRKVFFQ